MSRRNAPPVSKQLKLSRGRLIAAVSQKRAVPPVKTEIDVFEAAQKLDKDYTQMRDALVASTRPIEIADVKHIIDEAFERFIADPGDKPA